MKDYKAKKRSTASFSGWKEGNDGDQRRGIDSEGDKGYD